MIRSWLDKNARNLAVSLVMALAFLYLLYQTVQGDRGILTMLRMQKEVANSELDLAQTRHEREVLEGRVKRMRAEGIDPDLLDEQVRKQLDMAKPDEVIVIVPGAQEHVAPPQMMQRKKK